MDEAKQNSKESLKTTVPFWRQLRVGLILSFVGLAVIPMAFAVYITLEQVREQAREQIINQQLASVAELKQGQISRWLADSQAILDVFLVDAGRTEQLIDLVKATAPASVGQDEATIDELLANLAEAQPLFEAFFVYNLAGEVMAASDAVEIGKVVTSQPYFENSLKGDFIQTPYYAVGRDDLTMVMTRPLVDPQSRRTVGVLAGRLDIGTLQEIMINRTGLGAKGETYLVSRENNYFLTPSRDASYPLKRKYESKGINEALQQRDGSGAYLNYFKPEVPVYGVYRWLPDLQTAMLVEIEQAEALAAYRQAQFVSAMAAAVFALVAAGVGLYIATRISRPITSLTQAVARIAAGDLTQRAEVRQRNELGLLASAFNSMTRQLRELIGSLEEQVAARTRRLEIVATLEERLSGILKLETLLAEVVKQIKDNFDYYHVQIYLVDETGERLVVAEGTGQAGAEMKAAGHHIPLDARASLVARAARTGEVVRVDNVRQAEDWLPNSLLPETYAEMAAPIILEGQVVGVLDVQEDEVAGLGEGDEGLLRSLAGQVAIAMRNARLFAEVETALAQAGETQQRFVQQAWDRKKVTRRSAGRVQFSLGESTTLNERLISTAREQAMAQPQPAVIWLNENEVEQRIWKGTDGKGTDGKGTDGEGVDDSGLVEGEGGDEKRAAGGLAGSSNLAKQESEAICALVAPIRLYDTPIGNLQLHGIDPQRQWTEGELSLIKTVVDQVAQVAENMRLLNETQERASREQLISQISDKLRRAPDVETLMKIGVSELARVLGPARTFVRLGSAEELALRQAQDGPAGPGDES